jgi:hypothetical protein
VAVPPRPPPAAPVGRGAAFAALAVALALAGAGCGKTMTEEDCRKVGESMQAAWEAEVKKATPPEGTGAEKAAGVLKTEKDRLISEWTAECKKELQGRRVDAKEMDCLLAAKTLDQLAKCSEP